MMEGFMGWLNREDDQMAQPNSFPSRTPGQTPPLASNPSGRTFAPICIQYCATNSPPIRPSIISPCPSFTPHSSPLRSPVQVPRILTTFSAHLVNLLFSIPQLIKHQQSSRRNSCHSFTSSSAAWKYHSPHFFQ
ncbi:hypothetical protein Pst134EA_011306 [Puccinia striiformis f. sp. tritici]|uniref:hypothetical protein n=1 Tax=Puccinia striiformis f. sp. tritici TaxID=168172 RepID=UPI002008D8AC|nr:hypothetical protein Pst134EA_011306 [Puccinia striiformis f. sp. tritici]KAH9467670.1 hypothetical protein Pst134EA_011306 [Puccinia striiformis f. sp. tritici]